MILRQPSGRSAGLRVAVPKGTLWDGSLKALESAGVDVQPLAGAGRTLVVTSGEIGFVIAKPADIPAYVAYGAVDAAIVGKDVVLEAGLEVAEMVDLGFGACTFVVAEPDGAHLRVAESYRHLSVIRVATKYPRITQQHFEAKGVQVEVVKLNGNVEIAPLIGLADQIVDITATGTTLRENGLRVVEEVLKSSARFVANPASLRTSGARLTELAARLGRGTAS